MTLEKENKCFDVSDTAFQKNWCSAHSRGHSERDCVYYEQSVINYCIWWNGAVQCTNPNAIHDKDTMKALDNI